MAKAEAEMVVAASKFKNDEFPMGRRGMFGSRQGFGVKDYFMKANHETMTVILMCVMQFCFISISPDRLWIAARTSSL